MAKHATLSASGSHRWMNCTPSALLEKDVKDEGSDFAREGSLAHAYCAKSLKEMLGQSTKGEEIEIAELFLDYYTDEMGGHVETYTTIVTEKWQQARLASKDAVLMVEQTLDFSEWVPNGFGTGDAIIVADGTMEICDFKYGKGVEVSADHNSQMMIYALGALSKFSDEYAIDRVRMTIIQPRINNLSECELTVAELLEWAEKVLKPTAKKAIKGEGEQKAGDWCQFCKVKNQCRALAQHCMEDFDKLEGKIPELLSADEIAENILPKLASIKKWVDAIGDYALEQALTGVVFKGYKLVEGRSVRKIADDEKAAQKLIAAGYEPESLFKPRSLKGITDLEGICGKKNFGAIMGELLVKPQGKPALVPETDKRPALNTSTDDFNDIMN